MTATCREVCCSVAPRLGVSELFERGYRRSRAAPLAIVGGSCIGAENNAVCFSLDVTGGRIEAIGFDASCCATLIGYCEYIAEIAPGSRLEIAFELTAHNLIEGVAGVPAFKRDRALLAIAGFRTALLAADELQWRESTHESRLHLRHPAP